MERVLTLNEFTEIVPSICTRETSQNPDLWTRQNPTFANCIPVALLAQALFSGRIVESDIVDTILNRSVGRHYFNELPNGTDRDFTLNQFGEPWETVKVGRTYHPREQVMADLTIVELYRRLRLNLQIYLNRQIFTMKPRTSKIPVLAGIS